MGFVRRPDIAMTERDMRVDLENLMGDGLVGDLANSILQSVGENILLQNRDKLANLVRDKVVDIVDSFLVIP